MTPQPQQQIYSVGIKSPKEIERDEELQRAYVRGYEDGAASHTTPPPICDRCKTDQEPFCIGCERLIPHDTAIAARAREKALKPISAIYERFKHLDAILSKRDPDCPMMLCYVDIWEAVKESLRTGGE